MFLIKNAKVYTITDGIKEKTDVLIKDGRIEKIEKNIKAPKGVKTIKAAGLSLYPGFIDAHCHVGIMEEGNGQVGDDTNEMIAPSTPHLRAIDGINHEDPGFKDSYEKGGVTSCMVAPGSANIIGGEVCFLNTYGETVDDMVIDACIGMKMALGENPKRVYGSQHKSPSTRMANASVMRENLFKAKEYSKKKGDKKAEQTFDLKMENLSKVIKKKIPARIHCHRADDIITALRVVKEFKIKAVIEHATDGHKVNKQLKDSKLPCCVGPTLIGRTKEELKDRSIETVKVLLEKGVDVAIITDHPVLPLHSLPMCAGYALKTGLSEEEILRTITINPARICGVDKKVGSIEKGKQADVVLWSGNPLYPDSQVEKVWIKGDMVFEK